MSLEKPLARLVGGLLAALFLAGSCSAQAAWSRRLGALKSSSAKYRRMRPKPHRAVGAGRRVFRRGVLRARRNVVTKRAMRSSRGYNNTFGVRRGSRVRRVHGDRFGTTLRPMASAAQPAPQLQNWSTLGPVARVPYPEFERPVPQIGLLGENAKRARPGHPFLVAYEAGDAGLEAEEFKQAHGRYKKALALAVQHWGEDSPEAEGARQAIEVAQRKRYLFGDTSRHDKIANAEPEFESLVAQGQTARQRGDLHAAHRLFQEAVRFAPYDRQHDEAVGLVRQVERSLAERDDARASVITAVAD